MPHVCATGQAVIHVPTILVYSLPLVGGAWHIAGPDLVLCNGPGICIPSGYGGLKEVVHAHCV